MTQTYLQAAKTCFQSSNVVEITVETAREFASTSNNCTVNSSTNLNSIKSTVQCVNITRADPRVTHELFTMKLNSSKPQQPGTSKRKISHPSKKIRLIKMFDGIHRLFKQSLSQSSSHVPVSCFEKEEWPWHRGKCFISSRGFEQLSTAISA